MNVPLGRCWFFIGILVTGTSPFQSRADDSALRERLRTEAPPGWAKICELMEHVDVEFERVSTLTEKGKTVSSVWGFKSAAKNLVMVTDDKVTWSDNSRQPIRQGTVFGRNATKFFELKRARPNVPWVLANVSADLARGDGRIQQVHMERIPLLTLMVFHEYVPEWLQEPTFSIKSVDWDKKSTRSRVALTFEYQWPDGKKHHAAYWSKSGVLYLRPDLLWALEEAQTEMVDVLDQDKSVFHHSYMAQLQLLPGGLPTISQARRTSNSKSEGPGETVWNFTRFEQRNIPESEFALGAFGLPDIGSSSSGEQTQQPWLMLLLVGAFCLATAWYLRRRARA